MLEDDDSVFAAMRAGASGCLLKGAHQDEVLRAIRAVANGEAIFGPGIARRVMRYFSAEKPKHPPTFPELTEREREILAFIARGRTNADISRELFLSLKTVQNHVSNTFRKLHVAYRAGQPSAPERRGSTGKVCSLKDALRSPRIQSHGTCPVRLHGQHLPEPDLARRLRERLAARGAGSRGLRGRLQRAFRASNPERSIVLRSRHPTL
jgi:hypothetical protein